MNNRHLTAENAFNCAGFNKMLNPQADFFLNKIKHLQYVNFTVEVIAGTLEKYFFVHK